MVQSINAKAILTLASVLRRPYLLVPHVNVSNVSELDYSSLKNYVDAIVFDKDNTLTAPYENRIHHDASAGLLSAIEVFGEDRVAILSNSAGTKDDPEYLDAIEIENTLGIKVIRHDEKKPGGLDEVLNHFEMTDPCRICVVGDRLLTDIVFGNLYGMLSVHTLPLCKGEDNKKDNKVADTLRSVENSILYSNWFVGRWLKNSKCTHKFWPGEETNPLTTIENTSS
mmetsp:Transcript_16761/g.25328  ORF Transcript_16761/g.25328 Transcript_16761/m.25328 type:complete len:226 (+) Transcript_16761:88-765(+)|eukprot:CAMPEP_0178913522 /NCGR_PEP_ID=MMETSP0786-20121207/10890_1 /TAXON_ID=186022 /ORGANISM="Thalassionema frauenfeldii, Strain CCMP 1798" /LENGTH=225 /DNA_ID=CAMNT_0020586275 /DNA_START=37 /DNA_END=714 /DNA_ORIENTATION=+